MEPVTTWKQLGVEVPSEVRQSVKIAEISEHAAHIEWGWGRTVSCLLRLVRRPGERTVGVDITPLLPESGQVGRATDLLDKYIGKAPWLRGRLGHHRGIALVGETVHAGDPGDRVGADLEEYVLDRIAGGGQQRRMVVGVMRSGWRFVLKRTRHRNDIEITVLTPEQDWPFYIEVAEHLRRVNDSFTERPARRAV